MCSFFALSSVYAFGCCRATHDRHRKRFWRNLSGTLFSYWRLPRLLFTYPVVWHRSWYVLFFLCKILFIFCVFVFGRTYIKYRDDSTIASQLDCTVESYLVLFASRQWAKIKIWFGGKVSRSRYICSKSWVFAPTRNYCVRAPHKLNPSEVAPLVALKVHRHNKLRPPTRFQHAMALKYENHDVLSMVICRRQRTTGPKR